MQVASAADWGGQGSGRFGVPFTLSLLQPLPAVAVATASVGYNPHWSSFCPLKSEWKVGHPPPYLIPSMFFSKQDLQFDLQALHKQRSFSFVQALYLTPSSSLLLQLKKPQEKHSTCFSFYFLKFCIPRAPLGSVLVCTTADCRIVKSPSLWASSLSFQSGANPWKLLASVNLINSVIPNIKWW